MQMPPIFSEPVRESPHAEPFHILWYCALSVPSTNPRGRFVPHATPSGSPAKIPPMCSKPVREGPHAEPFHHLWYSAPSVPVTNTSSRFGPQATARGADMQ